MLNLPTGNAICYSGYRRGQSPGDRIYPSKAEILEDLRLLAGHWQLLRLYDSGPHAERVLEVIREAGLSFRILLGAHIGAEVNNPACPWGTTYTESALRASHAENDAEVERLVALARQFEDLVFAVAVGNEATVEWTDHLVPVDRLGELVRRVKSRVHQPVTICENYVPWQHQLRQVGGELDFISLHTYPVWEYKQVHEALRYTQDNYASVARCYPDKPVVITEAGWATNANGRGIHPENASEELQAIYCGDLLAWARAAGILIFVFEAFDEPWKGSADPLEPEKHWGLFTVDRRPKLVMRSRFPVVAPEEE
ncbi:MAG: glycosyl hydrolase [Geothrix sp.]|uniref:glycosyl hydrolase family 17 protein n=1 Tax=Geothrix sp. TaxID=1962974 RepID=UPI00183CCE5B|nr:glycosyl hydrolase family 17 protein [Geothrix sp.]NWJ41718.1 glycosyl hydrolase [Geothrix sp.]WIL20302.1 MAG: glycosyl hydrolase family 17 protein [Geothrix sp.]